jgi:hypothetical protein
MAELEAAHGRGGHARAGDQLRAIAAVGRSWGHGSTVKCGRSPFRRRPEIALRSACPKERSTVMPMPE